MRAESAVDVTPVTQAGFPMLMLGRISLCDEEYAARTRRMAGGGANPGRPSVAPRGPWVAAEAACSDASVGADTGSFQASDTGVAGSCATCVSSWTSRP